LGVRLSLRLCESAPPATRARGQPDWTVMASASGAPPQTVRKCNTCHARATAALMYACGIGLGRASADCENATLATPERRRPLWAVVVSVSDAPPPTVRKCHACHAKAEARPPTRLRRLCENATPATPQRRQPFWAVAVSASDATPPTARKCHACYAKAHRGMPCRRSFSRGGVPLFFWSGLPVQQTPSKKAGRRES
jgi:hypothetical protein